MPLVSQLRPPLRSWKRSPKAVAVIATELREGRVSHSTLNPVFSLLERSSGSDHFKPKHSQYAGGIEGLGRGGNMRAGAPLSIRNVPESPVWPAVGTVLRSDLCVSGPRCRAISCFRLEQPFQDHKTRSGPAWSS